MVCIPLCASILFVLPAGNHPNAISACVSAVASVSSTSVSSLLLNFLPLGNQLIHIILFVQLSSHCLRIQLPHPQRTFAAHHVLGHRSPLRRSRATDLLLTELHVLSTAPLGDCDLRSGVSSGWFSCTSPRCSFSLFNISLPYCLTSFRLAIN